MKKYILTSEKFTGEVHLVYNDEHTVAKIDMMSASLSKEQVHWLKTQTPTACSSAELIQYFSEREVTATQQEFQVTFEMFWERYGHKIKKKQAMQLWNKMSLSKRLKAYAGIIPYKNYLSHRSWQTQANPETYLKHEYWETDWSKAT